MGLIELGLERVSIEKDDDGHNYIIPYHLRDRFHNLLANEDMEDRFIEEFSKYMTGGDVNLVSLYASVNRDKH